MARNVPTRRVQLTDDELKRQLSAFEAQYGMTSVAFLQRYTAGELGDDLAFIRWSGLLRIASKAGLFEPAQP
ncbi:MAG: hypothetical protein ACYDCQ_03715 [Dehalococcoidia bacterium]